MQNNVIKQMSKNAFHNNCIIQNKDFSMLLKTIPKETVDLILTDPPYLISKKTGFNHLGKKSIKRFAVSMDFGKWDHQKINLVSFAKQSHHILRKGGTIICFYDLWKITYLQKAFIKAGFGMIRLIIWEKTNPVPLNSKSNYLTNAREIAVLGIKGLNPTFNSKYDSGVYHFPIHREKRIHPTQKPLELMKELIKKHSHPYDLIVDPFMGSGTTAIAALKLKRFFIGGDKSKNYTKKAKQRITQQIYKQNTLLLNRKAKQHKAV